MTASENYVEIVEVSPRDGLQGLSRVVETEQKLDLIRALGEAGFKRIEVTSLVSPKYVPQMADAVQLLSQLGNQLNFSRMVLVLNEKGYKRAIELGVEWICYVIAATESMSRKNANTSIAQSIKDIKKCIYDAHNAGIKVRASIAVCWACPYEGKVPRQKVLDITSELTEADEIAYNDTLGIAVPSEVYELCCMAKEAFPSKKFAGHFHGANSGGLDNIKAALLAGWNVFDSAVASLGGCPFTPGAVGNVSSEGLVCMLEQMGLRTGIDQSKLSEARSIAIDIYRLHH